MEKFQLESFISLCVDSQTKLSQELTTKKSDELIKQIQDINKVIELLYKYQKNYIDVKPKINKK